MNMLMSENKNIQAVKSRMNMHSLYELRKILHYRENEVLWREVASLRQKHMKQTQIVNKVRFIIMWSAYYFELL